MADVNAANESPAEEKPVLVAVDGEGARPLEGSATPAAESVERRGVSRGTFWTLAVLLVLAVAALALQTQRVATLETQVEGLALQVEGLRTELTLANTQIQTYAMTLSLVRDTVSDIFEKAALLSQLVQNDTTPPPVELEGRAGP